MTRPADLIIHSGKLWDGSHREGVDAIAVAAGRILATGTSADLEPLRSEMTSVIDAGARRVMPGLIDSHLHMVRAGLRWDVDIRWHDLTSLSQGLELIARAGEDRPGGHWIAVLGGWHPGQFSEGRAPSRSELDEAAPDHPVFVQRNYIEAYLNTRALQKMGWDKGQMPEWPAALQLLREKLTAPDPDTRAASTEGMLRDLN
ncbi:MAG: amidohydrolase family protein, partial [Acidimicrobiia bacterium]